LERGDYPLTVSSFNRVIGRLAGYFRRVPTLCRATRLLPGLRL